MALIVEDGSGVDGANTYASEADFDTYCDDRGITPASGDTEAALIRGTQAIEGLYRGRWSGVKTDADQALSWPRDGATDEDGSDIDNDVVPQNVIYATIEAAIREKVVTGSMTPDLKRGGAIKRVKAGSVEVEYADYAATQTTFTAIDNLLRGLLGSSSCGVTRLVRA